MCGTAGEWGLTGTDRSRVELYDIHVAMRQPWRANPIWQELVTGGKSGGPDARNLQRQTWRVDRSRRIVHRVRADLICVSFIGKAFVFKKRSWGNRV